MAKNRIPHSNTYQELIVLREGPYNALYTTWFSARVLIEAVDIWIERKLMCSLQVYPPYFSILAEECQNISTQEELSNCGRWLVNGKPEEHFLTVLHAHSTDAGTSAETFIPSYSRSNLI